MNLRRFILSALFFLLFLSGCGGGGGGSSSISDPGIKIEDIPVYFEIEGRIWPEALNASSAPNLRAADAGSSNQYSLFILDGAAGFVETGEVLVSGSSYRALFQIGDKICSPYIELREKQTGKTILKNYVGKLPSLSEIPSETRKIKIQGLDLDPVSTARALLISEKKVLSDISVVSVDTEEVIKNSGVILVDVTGKKTQFEASVDTNFLGGAESVKKMSEVVKTVVFTMGSGSAPQAVKDRIKTGSAAELITSFQNIITDGGAGYRKVLTDNSLAESVSFFGAVVGSTKTDPDGLVSLITDRPTDLTPPFIISFSISAETNALYSIRFKVSEKLYRLPKVKISGRSAEVNEITSGEYYASAAYSGSDPNPAPFEIDDLYDLAGNRAGLFAARMKIIPPEAPPGRVEAPVINPPAGTYDGSLEISITCGTPGAFIRYSTDGAEPSKTGGLLYAAPFKLVSSSTVKAAAFKGGMLDSPVSAAAYVLNITPVKAAPPVFDPPAGYYGGSVSVEISSPDAGTLIRYTTDGTLPSAQRGTLYSSPVGVSSRTLIKAISFGDGYLDSDIAEALYAVEAAAVTSAPVITGSQSGDQVIITITCPDGGAEIYYSFDGSVPSPSTALLYSGPFTVKIGSTIKALAIKQGYGPSILASAFFSASEKPVEPPPKASPPAFEPPAGKYKMPVTLKLTTASPGALIRYTLDGSAPSETAGAVYSLPFAINGGALVRAAAYGEKYSVSDISDAAYTADTTPVFIPVDTQGPAFTAAYFKDTELAEPAGDNPRLGAGMWYLAVRASERLKEPPLISITSENPANDTLEIVMTEGPGGYYFIERIIDAGAVSPGATLETILISGIDAAGNKTLNAPPQNSTAAARIDTVNPPPPQIANDPIDANLGGTGNSLNRINASLAGVMPAFAVKISNQSASSEDGALFIKLYDATGSRYAESSPAAILSGSAFSGRTGFSAGALDSFADGSIIIEARIRDAAGNLSATASVELAFCLDRLPPGALSISLSSPAAENTGYIKNGGSAVLKFKPSETLRETPEMSAAGRSAAPSLAEGGYEISLVMGASDEEGPVPFEIKCFDLAGNPSSFDAVTDGSFAVFDKTPPAITPGALSYPSGGERLRGTASAAITWNADAVSENIGFPALPVSLFLSPDSGLSWSPIESGLPNGGSYQWSVPALDTAGALVKLSFADLAGNTAEISSATPFVIDSQKPAPVSAIASPGNDYIDVTFSEGIYGPDGAAAASPSFSAVYEQNGGVTASVSIISVKKTDESELAGGESTARLHILLSALSSGVEKIKIGPSGAAALYDAAGNAMSGAAYSPSTALNDLRPPEILSLSISHAHDYIDIAFSEGIYGPDGAPLALSDLTAVFEKNSGKIDSVVVTGLKKTDGAPLSGGESIIRAALSITGTPTGVESIAFKPSSSAALFDAKGNAAAAEYISAAEYFIDSEAPAAPHSIVLTPIDGNVVTNTLNSTNTNIVVIAVIEAGSATGGKAVLYIDGRASATDETVLAADTMVSFDPACTTNGALAALIPSGGAVSVELFDAAGNNALSVTGNPTLTVDYTRPAAALTYSAASPYKSAQTVTITAEFDEPIPAGQTVSISTGGAAAMPPAAMTRTDDTHFTYSYTVPDGDGTVEVSLSGASDANGNPLAAGPASGANFAIDGTPPEAEVTYSPADPVKTGTVLTITASFSEPLAAVPPPSIAIAGANTRSAIAMTKIDDLNYKYLHTVAAGNGTASVTLSAATDLAGNPVVSTPASGAAFTVDNTAPAAYIEYSAPRVKKTAQLIITAVFTEPISETYPPKITSSGGEVFSALTMTRTEPNVYTYHRTIAGSGNGTASVTFSNARDLAGNAVAAAPQYGAQFYVDNTPPKAYITYSPAGPYSAGKNITIYAQFSEPMAASPAPSIAISGADTLASAEMTMTDSTHYRLEHTTGAGNGQANITFTAGADEAVNALAAVPLSGASFTLDNTPLAIAFASLAPENSYIDIGFSEGVFGSNDGQTPAGDSNFELAFSSNGGGATEAEITSVTSTSGTPLTGGETSVRVNLAITGAVEGVETITIAAASGAPLYDGAGLPMAADQNTGPALLNDSARPTISAAYSINPARYRAGTAFTITATFSEAGAAAPAPAITITGANSVVNAPMTFINSTRYSYAHTTGAGNGEAALSIAAKSSAAGLDFISTPSSGSAFTVDNTPPTFSVNGYQVNEAGDVIEITFNEDMTAAGLTTRTNWTLYHADSGAGFNQTAITTTNAILSYDSGTRILTITLNENIDNAFIPTGKFIGAVSNASNIKDAAGNATGALYVYSDEATPTEVQPPTFTVEGISRDNLGDQIILTFSDSMSNAGSALTTKTNWTFAKADDELGTNLTTLTITNATLSYSLATKKLTVTLHEGTDKAFIGAYKHIKATPHPLNIKDVAGNAVGEFSAYSAAVAPETVRPSVSSVTAISSGTGNDTIYIYFNDQMNQTAGLLNDRAKWSIQYADDAAGTNAVPFVLTNAAFALYFTSSYKRVNVTLSETVDRAYIPPGKYIIVTPLSEAPTDFAGNPLLLTPKATAAVVTTETTKPTFSFYRTYSYNNASDSVILTFSEPMNDLLWPLTDKASWQLEYADDTTGVNAVPLSIENAFITYNLPYKRLTFALNEPIDNAFLPGGKYVIATLLTPSNVRDLVGNQCSTVSKLYTTAVVKEATRPLISAVALQNADGIIADGDSIKLTFNEQIAPASIHPGLVKGGSVTIDSPVTGQVSWPAGSKTITIANICSFTIIKPANFVNARANTSRTTLSLDATGKILTVTLDDGVSSETVSAYTATTAITASTTTVTDLVGNKLNTSTAKVIAIGQKF